MIVFAHTKGFLNIGLFLKKEISALSGFPPFSNKPPPPPLLRYQKSIRPQALNRIVTVLQSPLQRLTLDGTISGLKSSDTSVFLKKMVEAAALTLYRLIKICSPGSKCQANHLLQFAPHEIGTYQTILNNYWMRFL